MFSLLLEVLGTGLSIWDHKEKNKYLDRYLRLKKEYYEEDNKPTDQRDDSVLDNLEFELRLLASGFAAEARKPDAQA